MPRLQRYVFNQTCPGAGAPGFCISRLWRLVDRLQFKIGHYPKVPAISSKARPIRRCINTMSATVIRVAEILGLPTRVPGVISM